MSQIATLLNFNLVRGEWTNKQTNLPEGARKNITENLGCEWQLGLYSKNPA
jgi:hypothetical protein